MNITNKKEREMEMPNVVSRDKWIAARKQLLAKEKDWNRQRDTLSAERRKLPMVRVEKDYVFEGPHGRRTRSFVADNFAGSLVHLAARDTSFAVISRAPLEKIERFKRRMGWSFPWLSSFGTDFNYDFQVTTDESHTEYNYAPLAIQVGKVPPWGEMPGLSVFLRDGERLFHTYSTYTRGLDLFLNTYNFLDHTPLGRQEEGRPIMEWLRHHDKY